jgi:dCMP deaminase
MMLPSVRRDTGRKPAGDCQAHGATSKAQFLSSNPEERSMTRISKDRYYLHIAKEVSMRATCLRRWFGAVIVQEDQIISTGYNGPPRSTKNCIEIGVCARELLNVKQGEKYEICRGVHAEQNAIIHASRLDMLGSTLFLVGVDAKTNEIVSNTEPCKICKRMIINAGIESVVVLKPGEQIVTFSVQEWIDNNIDELEFVDHQWRPIIKSGY